MPKCEPPTIEKLDLSQYEGVWWRIFWPKDSPFEKGCSSAQAEYCYDSESKCMTIKNICLDCRGCPIRQICGVLTPTCESGKFKVKFDGVEKCGDYWVHWTDYDNFAIVGGPKGWVWVLSRDKEYTLEQAKMLNNLIIQYGYDLHKIAYSKGDVVGARSKVRFVHNVFDGPNVDIFINGKKVLENVEYTRVSDYLSLKSKNTFVQVKPHGSRRAIISDRLELMMGQDYTFIVSGTVHSEVCPKIHLMVIYDDNACPLPCTSHLRFIHSNADIKAIDVWINEEPKFLALEYPFFSDVDYRECCSKFKNISIKSGVNKVQLKMKGTDQVIFETNIEFEDKKVYTLMPSGKWRATPDAGSFTILPMVGIDYCIAGC